jgi:uncharacterized repeat protein (TIGR04138 family)
LSDTKPPSSNSFGQPERPSHPGEGALSPVIARAKTFRPGAFKFVREGLAHTTTMIHGEATPTTESVENEGLLSTEIEPKNRHISGQQLCLGLKDYALRQYGLLAKTVLGHWGLRKTEDFGVIVFALIEAGALRKSDEDSLDDFRDVYMFDEAFAPSEAP